MYIYNNTRSLPQTRSPEKKEKKARKKPTQTFLLVECSRQAKAQFSQQNELHSNMYCFFVVYFDFYVLLIANVYMMHTNISEIDLRNWFWQSHAYILVLVDK